MQTRLTRTAATIFLLAAATGALQRPTGHSVARRSAASPATSPAWRGRRVDVDAIDATQADYNRPFRGAFKIESETVTASLRQLRETLSPYCDVNGCVVPESADDAGGFGGIIAPPWWDDFQEP